MRNCQYHVLVCTIFIQFLFIENITAQENNKRDRIKLKHALGIYNKKAERELKSELYMNKSIMRMRIEFSIDEIEDSLKTQIQRQNTDLEICMNFTNGTRWIIPYGIPRNPRIFERYQKNDYEITEDQEVLEWIHYMEILDYWKENKKLPYQMIESLSFVDTLNVMNSTKIQFKYECSFNLEGKRECDEIATLLN